MRTSSLRRLAGQGKRRLEAEIGLLLTEMGRPHPFRNPRIIESQWVRMLKRSAPLEADLSAGTGPRILFSVGCGFSWTSDYIHGTLALATALRGARPSFLICDHALPACEFNPLGNHEPNPGRFAEPFRSPGVNDMFMCDRCTTTLRRIYEPTGLPVFTFQQLKQPGDLARLETIVDSLAYEEYPRFAYKDVPVGEQAWASVLRALLRGTPEPDEATRWLFRRYLLSSMWIVDLADRLFEELQPDCLVGVHGVYVTHGTLCEVAKRRGIHPVIFGLSYRRNSVIFSSGDTYHRTLIDEPVSAWDNLQLTAEQDRTIREYMDSRTTGTKDWVVYHPNPIEEREQLVQSLWLDERPIVGLFTNVLWDAQIYYSRNAFANMLDWLFQTIEYFGRRDDLQLVIRVHPAEVKIGAPTNQPAIPEIEQRFPKLPANVKIIPPESDLSTYTLCDLMCAGLVYGTKLALEIAYRGTPVVIAGESFMRDKGFSYDASSPEEYFQLLDRLPSLPHTSDMAERAKRYAYHFFFRRTIDFRQVQAEGRLSFKGLRLGFKELSDLLPGRDAGLDLICNGLMKGTDFVFDGNGR